MVRVAKIRFVDIYAGDDDVYVVYNKKKSFKDGHTHIRNFSTAKYIANLIAYGKLPKNCHNQYILESLIRLETNQDHIHTLRHQQETIRKRRSRK